MVGKQILDYRQLILKMSICSDFNFFLTVLVKKLVVFPKKQVFFYIILCAKVNLINIAEFEKHVHTLLDR